MAQEEAGPVVLIVEDNVDERLIYTALLEHFGYRVLEAGDAIEGMRLAQEARPDLIMMDIMLPTLSGLLATEVLKSGERTSHIPIITMSHYDIPRDAPQLAGCERFVPKPISPRVLRAVVSEALGRPAGLE